MLTEEQVRHFETLGFLQCRQSFSQEEVARLSNAFDDAMKRARGGTPEPILEQDDDGYTRASQDEIPFFHQDPDVFYPLLDDPRIMEPLAQLLGDDFLLAMHSAVIYGGGTKWHHDVVAPEGFTTMRAAMYLDRLGPDDGCLTIMPGSHLKEYRDALVRGLGSFDNQNSLGVPLNDVPGQYDLVNEPGDVIFMNHKLYHCSIGRRAGVTPARRILRVTCVQNTSREKNEEHYRWLIEHLNGMTHDGRTIYGADLIAEAGPLCRAAIERGVALGFGMGELIGLD